MNTHKVAATDDGLLGVLSRGLGAGSSEELLRALLVRAPFPVFVTNADGECIYLNDRTLDLLGLPEQEALGLGWVAGLHPDDAEDVLRAWMAATGGDDDFAMEYRYRRPDGSVSWVEGRATAILGDRGEHLGWVGTCVDLTLRRLTEERSRGLVENAQDAIFTADATGRFASVNPAAERITGFSRKELLGMSFFDLIAHADVERAQAALTRRLAGGEGEIVELELVARDGHPVFAEVSGQLVNEDGQTVAIEAIARDTTARHVLESQLAHQAFHDALTGLPNRALFLDRLSQALARAQRDGSFVGVILLDLDNFKLVNDSFGHAAGDALLVAIAPRLQSRMRAADTLVRLSGDEFAAVLENVKSERELVAAAERLLSAFTEPFGDQPGADHVSATAGIVLGRDGDSPEVLLRNADTAMYRAKESRRGGFEIFDEEMRARVLHELTVGSALETALENGELDIYYQPIVSLADGSVLSVEALLRWHHPQWGPVAPSEFVPIAEENGQIVPIGQWVLAEAARQAADWRQRFPDAIPQGVFVNVSPRELSQPGFPSWLAGVLEKEGTCPGDLGIEITERVFIDHANRTLVENIDELVRMGIPFSLDDFGTGYSALATLTHFPFTALKVDRFFIRSIRTPTDTVPVTNAIVSLGRTLGLTVIAEGIENDVQADYLRRLGCTAGQGYHFARPQPAAELAALLEARAGAATARERSVA